MKIKTKTVLYLSHFVVIAVAALLYFLLSGQDVFGGSNVARYAVNLISFVVTCSAVVAAVSAAAILARLSHSGSDRQVSTERERRNAQIFRTACFAFALLVNVVLYAVAAYAENPKYCVLITLLLGVFTCPKLDVSSKD